MMVRSCSKETGYEKSQGNQSGPTAISWVVARPSFPITLPKLNRPKQPLASHHVEDPDALPVKAIKDPAGRLNNLPVSGTTELGGGGAAFAGPFHTFDMFGDPLAGTRRRVEVVPVEKMRGPDATVPLP